MNIKPKKKFWSNNTQSMSFSYLGVRNLFVSDGLIISDLSKFVEIEVQSGEQTIKGNELRDIASKFELFDATVCLNKDYIADYHGKGSKAQISFDIVSRPMTNMPEQVQSYSFEMLFEECESNLTFDFHFNDEFIAGYEHNSADLVFLGNVELECESPFSFSYPLNKCQLMIDPEQSPGIGAISFGATKLPSYNSRTGGLVSTVSESSNHCIQFEQILPNTKMIIPVYINLQKIEDPKEATDMVCNLAFSYEKMNITRNEKRRINFRITPNTTVASMLCEINDGSSFRELNAGMSMIDGRIKWMGNTDRGNSLCFVLRIGNKATNGKSKIEVRNLAISFRHNEKSLSAIMDSQSDLRGGKIQANDAALCNIFMVNRKGIDSLPRDYMFACNQNTDITVSFQHRSITNIPEDIATIDCILSYEYNIINPDEESEEKNYIPFESVIEFKIERYLGDYWLAIDFGTSASVAAFANGDTLTRSHRPDDLLIDLQRGLQKFLPNYDNEDIPEKGGKFLSSEMLLRYDTNNPPLLESTSYADDIVFLSPSKETYEQFRPFAVPYLKSLIGGNYLPRFNDNFERITYRQNKENNDVISYEEQPVKIERILENTYNLLLRDFITDAVSNAKNLNKVVLSIPNTFTPKHIEIIRRLFLKRFRNFKNDYIEFISESDAIACNYIANWEEYNRNRPDAATMRQNDEYVLVYDIGAGTTDITYFKIEKNADGSKNLEIIGKFGKTTAGNYLDYIVARIIDNLICDKANVRFVDGNIASRHLAEDIKFKIKNLIKPNFGNSYTFYIDKATGELTETFNDNAVEINTDMIENHEFMDLYLTENSSELFERFFGLFNRLTMGDTTELLQGEFPLDTVIYGGRSIQFTKLRKAVTDGLRQWTHNPDFYQIMDSESDKLKNVVVLGALQYAMVYRNRLNSPVKIKNRNIFARYGFLYRDFGSGLWRFTEILNPATQPLSINPHIRDGLTIYEYDTDVHSALDNGSSCTIDMRNTPTGYFVQSFSTDTARDINEQNWQYVTVIFKFNRDTVAFSGNLGNVPVRIVVNARNEMIVSVGMYENDARDPLKIDLEESETFRKSMWPYM
jgi:hypothetical protein